MTLSIGVKRVLMFTISGNTASEAVAARAGFSPDGEESTKGRPTAASEGQQLPPLIRPALAAMVSRCNTSGRSWRWEGD